MTGHQHQHPDRPDDGTARPAPVERIALPDGRTVWSVTRYAAVRALLADTDRFSNDASAMGAAAPLGALPAEVREVVAGDMLNTDPPRHTRLRQLVAHAFTARRVAGLRPSVERTAVRLAADLADRPDADLLAGYARPLPTLVLTALLGIPAADAGRVGAWSETFVTELLGAGDRDDLLAATRALLDYAGELVARRRTEAAGEDLVAELIGAGLDDTELVSMVFVLLVAGQTATAQLIAKTALLLLTDPGQLALARADRALIPGAVEEALRIDPPLRVSAFRRARRDVTVDGTVVPAGEIVLGSLSAAHRDPARYTDPDRADIRRTDLRHLAFGHGIHRCLGAGLARAEAEVAIAVLLDRFPALRLAGTGVRHQDAGIMRKITALPVRLLPG
ncbi:cytochrome P450 [Streptomyces sp. NPDC048290]|uniref:cytochrome P450 n=1 Tax=Streptomyces sp. NPDC048290 TaxID=3155811 RepID=UPI0034348CA6